MVDTCFVCNKKIHAKGVTQKSTGKRAHYSCSMQYFEEHRKEVEVKK